MCLFKVIVLLLIVFTVVVNGRTLRKRRQEARSSAYYGANGMGLYPYLNFVLGNNLYPIGNNWFVPGMPPYPYNNQFGYGMQQPPYMGSYGYSNPYNALGTVQYGSPGLNLQYQNNDLAYIGQSYVPTNNEWLPLPGRDRRRRRRRRQISRSVMSTTK